jgi:DNA mismatch repair protein MutL
VLGLPDRCHRHRPDWVKVAVNRRMVKLPELEQTILGTLRRTLPRDRFPICFVHLLLPPSQVDWHRCPTKSEVYLQDLEQWQARVAAAIAEALSLRSGSLPEAVQTQRVGRLLKAAEAKGGYYSTRQVQPVAPNQHLFGDSTRSAPLPDLKAIAQVRHTYILAEHSAGMWLVEQHIAHERVLYEQLCDRWHLVHLETPVILSQLSVVQLEQLHRIGLEVELFGDQLWAVRTAPEILVNREDCSEALWELSQGGDLQTAQVATACRSAIRNGTPLTLNEMQTLLEQWQRTQNPRTCPHGRPIYLSLEESSLSRFFRRHWVIGKSHGI